MVVIVEDEHVVLVVAPMAGGLPQLLADQARGANLGEASLAPYLARPVLERAPQCHAPRVEERRRRRLGMEGEQVELAAQLAVVPLPGLLDAPQMPIQLLLRLPGRAVDALQHRPRLVAPPVGARGVEQLEGAEILRRREVASPAQVLEASVPVERDRRPLRFGQVLDDLDLEGLALALEALYRLITRQVCRVLEGQVGGLLLAHLCLDLLEVGRRQWSRKVEVVVEAILDRRTDAQPGLRKELNHGGGHHVRRAVTHGREVVLRSGSEGGARVLGDLVGFD
jgi:hypothetical protein